MKSVNRTAALGALLLLSTAAWAMPNEAFQGKPDFEHGAALGAWVWHDADGHHVRFTTVDNKVPRRFSGKVCGPGAKMLGVTATREENHDKVRVGEDDHCVVFDFTTNAGVDGFDFRLPDTDKIVYDLEIDGSPMAASMIRLGKAGVNPENNPFILNR